MSEKDKKGGRHFQFIANDEACEICLKLDKQRFHESEREFLPPFTHKSWTGVPNCQCGVRWLEDDGDDDDLFIGGGGYEPSGKKLEELSELDIKDYSKFMKYVEDRKEKIDRKEKFLKKVKLGEERRADIVKGRVKRLMASGASLGDINKLLQTADLKKVTIDSDLPLTDKDKEIIEKMNQPYLITLDNEGEIQLSRDLTEINKTKEEKRRKKILDKINPDLDVKTHADLRKIELYRRDSESIPDKPRDFFSQEEIQRNRNVYKLSDRLAKDDLELEKNEWVKQYAEKDEAIKEDVSGIAATYNKLEMRRRKERAKYRYKHDQDFRDDVEKYREYEAMDVELARQKKEMRDEELAKHRLLVSRSLALKEKATTRGEILSKFKEEGRGEDARRLLADIEKPTDEFIREERTRSKDKNQSNLSDDSEMDQFKLNLFKELREYADNLKVTLEKFFQDEVKEYISEQAAEMGIFTNSKEMQESKEFYSSIDDFFGMSDEDERFKEILESINYEPEFGSETRSLLRSEYDVSLEKDINEFKQLASIPQGYDYDTSLLAESGEEVIPSQSEGTFRKAELVQMENRVSEITDRMNEIKAEMQKMKMEMSKLQQFQVSHQRTHGEY